MKGQSSTGRRGRPRDEEVDNRILTTTRDLFKVDGYMRMSVDSVAKAAGVTRPTIYLRWPSKAELVIAAITDLERPDEIALTGDSLADLNTIMHGIKVSFIDHGNAEIFGPLFTERHHEPELIKQFRERLLTPRRKSLVHVLSSGVETGQLRPDLDIDAAVNTLVGALYAKLVTGDAVADDFSTHVVDTLWKGLARGESDTQRG
jgi:AcrR family transcriptional regulator